MSVFLLVSIIFVFPGTVHGNHFYFGNLEAFSERNVCQVLTMLHRACIIIIIKSLLRKLDEIVHTVTDRNCTIA